MPEIFVALRELSTILNNAESITHPIKFVYAVRDDIFTEKDRTKFFDFIIPIIPIINSTNSGETLTRLLNEAKETTDISNEYIMDIAPYISDMRLLQNICNEFFIYKKTLQSAQSLNLKDKMMFSLIIFKNLYPKDFADLQEEKGIVKQAFEEKCKYIANESEVLQSEIRDLNEKLNNIHKEVMRNRQELIISFLCAVSNWQGYTIHILNNGHRLYAYDFLRPEFDFEKFRNSLTSVKNIIVSFNYFSNNSNNTYNCPTNDPLFEQYSERFEYVSTIENQKVENLRKEIENKQGKIITIREYTLKMLIEEFDINVFASDEIKSNKLLIYMLRMGYIDESYTNYINYFKGTSITTADMNFILSIKNHEPLPPYYDLSQIEQIVNRLQPQEFEQEEIFNFKLLEYLLNNDKNKEKRARFICKLSDGSEKSWLFLDEFVNKKLHTNILFHEVSNIWHDFWSQILQKDIFTHEKKNYYLSMILTHADIEDIKIQNEKDEISNYILQNTSILNELANVPTKKLITVIDELGIYFTDVDLTNCDKAISSYVINENRYEICPVMIQQVIKPTDLRSLPNLNNQNYTTLLNINNETILKYIHSDWGKYVEGIILSQDNTEESSETVIEILRKTIENIEICVNVIKHQKTFKLLKLEDCTFDNEIKDKNNLKPIWNQLLVDNKLQPSWENVLLYWNTFKLTQELIDFLESNANSFSNSTPDEINEDFIKEYLTSNGDDEGYRSLTKILKLTKFDISIASIPENRLKILIENKYFPLSLEIYNQIKSTYPGLSIYVILNNQQEFISLMKDIQLNKVLLNELIQSETATKDFKESLLQYFGKANMSEDLAKELCKSTYCTTREVFFAAWNILDDESKKELLYTNLNNLEADDFERCFSELDEFKDFRERTKHYVKLAYNENNQNLAERLREVGYITKSKLEDKKTSNETNNTQTLICIVKQLNIKS